MHHDPLHSVLPAERAGRGGYVAFGDAGPNTGGGQHVVVLSQEPDTLHRETVSRTVTAQGLQISGGPMPIGEVLPDHHGTRPQPPQEHVVDELLR